MLAMAITSFFCAEPNFSITTNIIAIFVIVAILLVFDTVESLSISNVLTLKKKVKEKETEVSRLNNENIQLRNQFISMSSTLNNQTLNQINLGDYGKGLEVKSASEDEIKQEKAVNAIVDGSSKGQTVVHNARFNGARFASEFEKLLIDKFAAKNNLDVTNLRKDIKITGVISKTDPIIDKDIMYDAYLRRSVDEVFIEISLVSNYHMMMDYRLYFMISRVYHYSKANQVKAKLVLVVPRIPKDYIESKPEWILRNNPSQVVSRLKKLYSPAIENDLLEIEEIDVSKEEMQNIINSVNSTN